MKNILKKGFTLIELLIVIGILGILIAAVLFTLNPAEAQRKGRDVQRLRDLGTLQTVMENLVQDNVLVDIDTVEVADSSSGASACADNWLNTAFAVGDLCAYASKIPVDPSNAATTTIATGVIETTGKCTASEATGVPAYYYVIFDGTADTYEINVRQESKAGCSKLGGDGGDEEDFVEAGTGIKIVH